MERRVKIIDELKIEPASEFVWVKVDPDDEERTAGGIIIPVGALANKKTQTGVIEAVGPGRRNPQDSYQRIPMDCKVGDHILFAAFIGYPLVVKSEEYVIIKHSDIMGRVHEVCRYIPEDEAGTVETDQQAIVI